MNDLMLFQKKVSLTTEKLFKNEFMMSIEKLSMRQKVKERRPRLLKDLFIKKNQAFISLFGLVTYRYYFRYTKHHYQPISIFCQDNNQILFALSVDKRIAKFHGSAVYPILQVLYLAI